MRIPRMLNGGRALTAAWLQPGWSSVRAGPAYVPANRYLLFSAASLALLLVMGFSSGIKAREAAFLVKSSSSTYKNDWIRGITSKLIKQYEKYKCRKTENVLHLTKLSQSFQVLILLQTKEHTAKTLTNMQFARSIQDFTKKWTKKLLPNKF